MQLTLEMHGETFVGVQGRLQGAAHLAHLHVLVFVGERVVNQGFKFRLLPLKFLNLFQDGFGLLDFAFFSEFLSLLVVNADFLVKLVNFLVG